MASAKLILLAVMSLLFVFITSCSSEKIVTAAPANAEPVNFVTADGITLQGHILGTGDEGVILSHMWRDDESRWFDFASALSDKGYSVLTYNFRGYGDSMEKRDVSLIDRDLEAAVRTLKERRNIKRLYLVGSSMGGTASLKVAAREKVDGLILLSAPVEISDLDSSDAIGLVSAPKLLIYSEDDIVANESARYFLENGKAPIFLEALIGSEHGTDILYGENGPRIKDLIVHFIGQNSASRLNTP